MNPNEFEKFKTNKDFMDFRKKCSYRNSNIWWPVKIIYAGKKSYTMTKLSYCINPKTNIISYYCNNHQLNTDNKRRIFKNQPCNGKIEYHRDSQNFYLVQKHNKICDLMDVKEYDNTASVTNNVKNYTQYKKELTNYLNSHPLITINNFKKYAKNLFDKSKFNFINTDNFYKNIWTFIENNN